MTSSDNAQYVNLKVQLIKGDDGKITVGDVVGNNVAIETQVNDIMNPATPEGNQRATSNATAEATTAENEEGNKEETPSTDGGKKRRTHRKKSRRNRRRRSVRYTRN